MSEKLKKESEAKVPPVKDQEQVHSAARVKRAKEVFKSYPGREKIFFTSEDTCFIEAQHAHMHAASLADQTVTEFERKDI